jgi:hypothetical protein
LQNIKPKIEKVTLKSDKLSKDDVGILESMLGGDSESDSDSDSDLDQLGSEVQGIMSMTSEEDHHFVYNQSTEFEGLVIQEEPAQSVLEDKGADELFEEAPVSSNIAFEGLYIEILVDDTGNEIEEETIEEEAVSEEEEEEEVAPQSRPQSILAARANRQRKEEKLERESLDQPLSLSSSLEMKAAPVAPSEKDKRILAVQDDNSAKQ